MHLDKMEIPQQYNIHYYYKEFRGCYTMKQFVVFWCALCISVRRLIEGKEYQFRVLAENLYGTSDPSEDSLRVLLQEPKIEIDYDKLGGSNNFCENFKVSYEIR